MTALNIKRGSTSHSAYDLRDPFTEVIESHTLAVTVVNESGVLARVIGLFSGRGYNIDSLTVAEVDHTGHRSRITVVTRGTPAVIDQIEAQLSRMVPVHDHRVPAEEVSQALQRLRQQNAAAADALAGSVPLCNEDLVQQDAYRHFPTAWVVRKGSAHPRPLVAAMPMPYWRQGIRLRMVQAGKPKAD